LEFHPHVTRYTLSESPAAILEGIEARALSHGIELQVSEGKLNTLLRLTEGEPKGPNRLPAITIIEVVLRFREVGGCTHVSVRQRKRRRVWALGLIALGTAAALFVDVFCMSRVTLRVFEDVWATKKRNRQQSPLMLESTAGFLAPRDLGPSLAGPFRASLPA